GGCPTGGWLLPWVSDLLLAQWAYLAYLGVKLFLERGHLLLQATDFRTLLYRLVNQGPQPAGLVLGASHLGGGSLDGSQVGDGTLKNSTEPLGFSNQPAQLLVLVLQLLPCFPLHHR